MNAFDTPANRQAPETKDVLQSKALPELKELRDPKSDVFAASHDVRDRMVSLAEKDANVQSQTLDQTAQKMLALENKVNSEREASARRNKSADAVVNTVTEAASGTLLPTSETKRPTQA